MDSELEFVLLSLGLSKAPFGEHPQIEMQDHEAGEIDGHGLPHVPVEVDQEHAARDALEHGCFDHNLERAVRVEHEQCDGDRLQQHERREASRCRPERLGHFERVENDRQSVVEVVQAHHVQLAQTKTNNGGRDSIFLLISKIGKKNR